MMFSRQQAPYTIAAALFMTAQPILTAYSRNSDGNYSYSAGSSLACSEVIKLLISIVLLCHMLLTSPKGSVKVLDDSPCKEYAAYSVPSFVYFVTNNLQFIILQALSPTTAQLLAQLKTIFTGILFRLMLNRRLTAFQWLALLTLACGTACSQIPSTVGHLLILTDTHSYSSHPVNWLHQNTAPADHTVSLFTFDPSTYAAVGLIASIVAALLSSLAGVYNEKLMKGRFSAPIHWQNIQMYTWGVIMNTIYAFVIDGKNIMANGFFAGYDWRTWMVVFANALAGLVISGVLKYCDNIARVYAAAMAMIITLFLSVPLFHTLVTPQIVIAFFLVVISTLQFNLTDEVADKFDRPPDWEKAKAENAAEEGKGDPAKSA